MSNRAKMIKETRALMAKRHGVHQSRMLGHFQDDIQAAGSDEETMSVDDFLTRLEPEDDETEMYEQENQQG